METGPCVQTPEARVYPAASPHEQSPLSIPKSYYSKLVNWMIEVSTFHPTGIPIEFIGVIQIMDHLESTKESKYLSKLFLDRFLLSGQLETLHQYQLLVLACIVQALKIQPNSLLGCNSPLQIFSCDELDLYLKIVSNQCLEDQSVKTPYHYIQLVAAKLDISPQSCGIADLEDIIEFCVGIPQLVSYSSKEIFFATLIYLGSQKGWDQDNVELMTLSQICPRANAAKNIISQELDEEEEGVEISQEGAMVV